MANKRIFEIAFVGLKPGIHEYEYEVGDKFFVDKGATDFTNCTANVKLQIDKKSSFIIFWNNNFIFSQDYFPTNDGISFNNSNYTLFTNAKIYSSDKNIIEDGSMLIKNGKIIAVGKSVEIPKNSIIINLNGKSIYPSFIDIYSKFGVKAPERNFSGRRSPQYNNTRKGYYWNDHIRPEQSAIDFFKYDERTAKELIKNGFSIVIYANHLLRASYKAMYTTAKKISGSAFDDKLISQKYRIINEAKHAIGMTIPFNPRI